jgi:hypothetical protein
METGLCFARVSEKALRQALAEGGLRLKVER